MRRLTVYLAVATVTVACGGKRAAAPPADSSVVANAATPSVASGVTCTMHFTSGPIADPGAPCTVEADYFNGSGRSVVEIGMLRGNLQARFNFTVPGHLDTLPKTNTTDSVTGLLDVSTGGHAFEMTTAPGSATGTFALRLTKVTTNSTNGGTINFAIAGTLDATVPADTTSGATGTVTIHAVFAP